LRGVDRVSETGGVFVPRFFIIYAYSLSQLRQDGIPPRRYSPHPGGSLRIGFRSYKTRSQSDFKISPCRLNYQPHILHFASVLLAGGDYINPGGIDARMSEDVRKLHDVLFH